MRSNHDKARGDYWSRSWSQAQDSNDYGRSFGDHARPYGEDYGEDSPYPGDFEDARNVDRFGLRRRSPARRNTAGFRYGPQERGWWDRAGDEVLSWLGDDYAERRRRRDELHRGKGPRNYRRSDERIREDINDALTDEWNIDASDIEVAVAYGEVILSGYVIDKFQKRRAEDLAEDVRGVTHVENRIRIYKPMTEIG